MPWPKTHKHIFPRTFLPWSLKNQNLGQRVWGGHSRNGWGVAAGILWSTWAGVQTLGENSNFPMWHEVKTWCVPNSLRWAQVTRWAPKCAEFRYSAAVAPCAKQAECMEVHATQISRYRSNVRICQELCMLAMGQSLTKVYLLLVQESHLWIPVCVPAGHHILQRQLISAMWTKKLGIPRYTKIFNAEAVRRMLIDLSSDQAASPEWQPWWRGRLPLACSERFPCTQTTVEPCPKMSQDQDIQRHPAKSRMSPTSVSSTASWHGWGWTSGSHRWSPCVRPPTQEDGM
jgi:hypothetical protein